MKKTKLLTMLGAVALIGAIGVGSTLAYLSDTTDVVENTFTVGKVEISLDETDNDNLSGDRVTENEYTNMIPGTTYTKDPTVHVTNDSEDCYVFVKITGIKEIENADGTIAVVSTDEMLTVNGFNANLEKVAGTEDIYKYTIKVEKVNQNDNDIKIFDSITLNKDVEGGEPNEITVKAFAIQAGGDITDAEMAAEATNALK